MSASECSVDGCDVTATSKGLCGRHYMRKRRQETGPFTMPVCCARLTSKVTMAEDDLRRAARAAASRPTDRKVKAALAAREVVRKHRLALDDHLSSCTAGASGGAS